MKKTILSILFLSIGYFGYYLQDTIQHFVTKASPSSETLESSSKLPLFVGELKKHWRSEDYYVEVSIAKKASIPEGSAYYDWKVNEIFNKSEVVFSKFETVRYRLNREFYEKYLDYKNTDTLFVIGQNQDVIEELPRIRFEYYSTGGRSKFVAVYRGSDHLEGHAVISKRGFYEAQNLKSPSFKVDSTYLMDIAKRNNFSPHFRNGGHTILKGDTISFLYYGLVSEEKGIYLFKNGVLYNAIKGKIGIENLRPIPLASQKEIFYVAKTFISHSDAIWTSLVSIDLKRMKLKIENDRFAIE